MKITEHGLKAAMDTYSSHHGPEAIDMMRAALEAYEAVRFGDVEVERRPWFVAHFDYHRAIGQGMEEDEALWRALQAYEGQKALEAESRKTSSPITSG